jgi:excisionase family DNA binding protein
MSTLNNSPEAATNLTSKQLASRWMVTEMTLRRWRSSGLLPAVRIGPRRLLFRMADVLAHEEKNRIQVAANA